MSASRLLDKVPAVLFERAQVLFLIPGGCTILCPLSPRIFKCLISMDIERYAPFPALGLFHIGWRYRFILIEGGGEQSGGSERVLGASVDAGERFVKIMAISFCGVVWKGECEMIDTFTRDNVCASIKHGNSALSWPPRRISSFSRENLSMKIV
mmetsp:Transcript_15997/g.33069  ORF Transcript_15997/g.33069 Transcript_15997/m.33069 type:complete len:154 (-) Transcript_15997:186-647(-)